MRIIKEAFLKAAAKKHPRAAESLASWIDAVRVAKWQTAVEMKQTFPSVDPVKVRSGNTVYVFNLRRNEFRLVCAVHFRGQRVYTLRFFTHQEYDRRTWEAEL